MQLKKHQIIIIIIFFFRPMGILLHYFPVGALYLEPRTKPYEIRLYLHCSLLRALTVRRFRPTRPPYQIRMEKIRDLDPIPDSHKNRCGSQILLFTAGAPVRHGPLLHVTNVQCCEAIPFWTGSGSRFT